MGVVLQLLFTGLGTEPVSDPAGPDVGDGSADCGMLGLAQEIDPGEILAFSWDAGDPDHVCRQIRQAIETIKPDILIGHAHSFGNSLACFFTQWTERWHQSDQVFDVVLGYDPCRNNRFGLARWRLAPSTCKRYLTHYQHGGRPFGVSGTPFEEQAGGENVDVTSWSGPTLAHVDFFKWKGIINDQRVRARVRQVAQSVMVARGAGG